MDFIGYILLSIIGWFLGLFALFSGPIAFIWLFFLRKQIAALLEQNRKLESTLRRLHHDIHTNRPDTPKTDVITIETEKPPEQPAQPFRPAAPVVPFVVAPPPVAEPAAGHDSGSRRYFEDAKTITAARTTSDWTKSADSAHAQAKKRTKKSESDWKSGLELWIGQKLIGWVAVVLFIVAAALLIQYSISMGWFTNSLKVAAIAAFGTALLGVGWYSRRTGLRRFSTMMSSAGIILIYLAGYASFGFYHLISSQTASMVMPGIVFGGFLLAWFYRSKLLGTVTILGGLAVPVLLSSGSDRHVELFLYLMLLNIGTVLLVNLLRRAPIAFIAFFGTQALFWIWYGDYYTVEKIVPALLFQSAFYLVFLADNVIAALRPIGKRLIPTWDDAMRAVLAPIIFFGSVYIVSEREPTFLHDTLGYFAFGMAMWYALLAALYSRMKAGSAATRSDRIDSPNDPVATAIAYAPGFQHFHYWTAAPSAAVVIALGFVAIGIPLQFSATWITLGWLTVFAGLWFFGHRQTNKTFVVMAYIFFGLGAIRLAGEIIAQLGGVREQIEMLALFNSTALPMLASATMLIVAAVLKTADCRRQTADSSSAVCCLPSAIFGHLGYLLLGVILSGEGARYLYANPSIWEPYEAQYLLSAFLLGFWFALAVILLELGTVFRNAVVAIAATLGLAFITILMVFIGFQMRVQYDAAFNNPFSVILIAGSVMLLLLGFQSSFFHTKAQRHEGESPLHEKNILGGFGIAGLFMLIAILTIEWFNYLAPDLGKIATFRSVTVFWAFCALFLLAPRFSSDSLPLRICGMVVLFAALLKTTFIDSTVSFGYCSWEWGAEYSLEDWIPLFNPYFMTMFTPVSLAIGFAVWMNRHGSRERNAVERPDQPTNDPVAAPPGFHSISERIAWQAAGIIGLFALFIYLSVECYRFFDVRDTLSEHYWRSFVGANALTLQWTVFALLLTLLAWQFHSKVLRILAMCLLLLALFNVLLGLDFRPDTLRLPFLNLYAVPMLIVSAAFIGFGGLWLYRLGEEDEGERSVYRILMFGGVVFLWFTMSIECFRSVRALAGAGDNAWWAQMALTSFWTGLAVILTLCAMHFKSKVLRIIAMLLLCLTVFKVLGIDMLVRPEYAMPFFNPYAMPILLLSMVVLALGCIWTSRLGDDDAAEREFYRYVAFAGVAFLWFTMSAECFRSVRLLAGAADEAWRAQMALSILWSLFAGVLIAIGFIWRSSILRWMAILLFGTTLLKVLIVDMQGVHELYRFGAVFVLALLLMSAAWAYQRFKPEG